MTKNVLGQKRNKTITKKAKKNIKQLPEQGIEPETSLTQSGCVISAPSSELRVMIVVKLFNCFDPMGQNVNKQSRICGLHIFNKFIVSLIILHSLITI